MKRGQISIFIIIGILILIVVSIIFFIKSEAYQNIINQVRLVQQPQEFESVKQQIQSCLENSAENTIFNIGQQGGYNLLKEPYDHNNIVPYYFYNNQTKFLTKEELQEEISNYMESTTGNCEIEQENINITYKDLKITTRLGDKTYFDIFWEIQLSKDKMSTKLDKFMVSKNINLLKINTASREIANAFKLNPEGVCISCLSDIAEQYNLNIITYFNEKDLLVKLRDESFKIYNQSYEFKFSGKFSGSLT